MDERYDVIIAGASFGGLAVASRLRAKALIIDRYPIGTHQQSACGTFLHVPRALGLMEAVVSVNGRAVIHAPGVPSYRLEDSLCTLDYRAFCEGLHSQGCADFVQASVRGVERADGDLVVTTDQGRFRGRFVVDATGWRAGVAAALRPGYVQRPALSYGLETVAAYHADAFYFWFERQVVRDGYAWIFPCAEGSRIGLASYPNRTVKSAQVRDFLRLLGAAPSGYHGGFIPHALRPPTVEDVFVVGDAAGQCFPFTLEGIRPAIYFGQHCGDLLQRVLAGDLSPAAASAQYRRLVGRYRWRYRALELAHRTMPHVPPDVLAGLSRLSELPWVHRPLLHRYMTGMAPLPPASNGRAGLPARETAKEETMATVKDPVCGMDIDPSKAAGSAQHQGTTYYFCSTGCLRSFQGDPAKYVKA